MSQLVITVLGIMVLLNFIYGCKSKISLLLSPLCLYGISICSCNDHVYDAPVMCTDQKLTGRIKY